MKPITFVWCIYAANVQVSQKELRFL